MLCKIHITENAVIMAMLLVDVGSDDILILAAENFIGKLPPDLVGLCIADLTRLKGLYQMVSEIVAFLHGKQPCFFKLKVCGFSTVQPNEDTSSLSAVIAFTSL